VGKSMKRKVRGFADVKWVNQNLRKIMGAAKETHRPLREIETMGKERTTFGVTPAQIKKLHALKTALDLDDAAYRAALATCGVETSKALSFSGAAELIDDFEKKAVSAGLWEKRHRPATESRREGFASPAQLALIEKLWSEVSNASDKKTSLRHFVTRQAKVSDPRFLRDCDVSKVICGLKGMLAQKKTEGARG